MLFAPPYQPTTSMFDILALGEAVVDLISVERGVTLDDVDTFRRYLGGAPVNVAATAVRLGCNAAVMARVGDEAWGRYVRSELRRLGVADDFVQVDHEHVTTLVFVASTTGSPDFLVVRGADAYLSPGVDGSGLIDHALARTRALHVSMFALSREPARATVAEAVRRAHAQGKLVSLDPNYRPRLWPDSSVLHGLLRDLLPLTSVIKPSLDDASAIWGPGLSPQQYIAHFHEYGAPLVVLTMGKDGVLVSDGATPTFLETQPIEIADATGAGDSFVAGMIMGLLEGFAPVRAARLGQRVAAAKLQGIGNTAPLPTWTTLIRDE